jgi:hypothetical protein
MKMKIVSVFFAHLSSVEKKPRMRGSVIKLAIAPLLVIFLLGCAGMPVQPEKIEKMSEQEAYEQLFWGMPLASYYAGWTKISRENFIKKVTQKIFEYHPKWDQQTRAAMLNAAIIFPSDPTILGSSIKEIEEYPNIFRKTWLLEVFEDPRATEAFLAALKVKYCIIAKTYPAFIRIGKADTEGLLIEALEKCGYGKMAEDFLNCGNDQLAQAGWEWAILHRSEITARSSGGEGPMWGRK